MKRQWLLGNAAQGLSVLFLLVLFAASLFSQQSSSSVRGTVKDQQGNVVAGATVTLTSLGTNNVRTTTTADNGIFSFEAIAAGDYKVEIAAPGFKKSVVTDIHVLVSKPTSIDIQLEIGNVAESVTVAAGSAELLVNHEDATLGNNFVNKQITQLPLEARNVPNLLTLQPATTRDGAVAGARADQSNITLDGVDVNEAQTNQIINPNADPSNVILQLTPERSTVLRLNAEAIEEFRVTTANPNATQGRSAGAQVSLVTKSGSNEFHGAGFEFYRTKKFAANNFFNNKAGVPKPALIRHTFGGALGGPVVKDRAFFFYSFEGDRITQSTTQLRDVPLASLGRGEVRYKNPAGGITTLTTAQLTSIFPAVGINPLSVSILAQAAAKYPANDFTIGDGLNTGGFRFSAPVPVNRNSHAGKFDFNLTSKQQAFVRVNVIYDLIAREQQFPDTPAPNIWSHPMGIAAGHTWTASDNLINNFRYGLTREAYSEQGDSAANSISFRFVFSPLTYSRTLTRVTPVHNFTDDVSWIKGNHSFSFGANIRRISNTRVSLSNAFDSAITNPSFYSGGGTSLSNPINAFSPISGSASGVQNAVTALIGRYSQYSAAFTFDHDGSLLPSGTASNRDFRTQEYDGYIQDSWKYSSNLTLTFGLRYTISKPVYEKNGFEVRTGVPLSDFFEMRKESAARGVNLQTPLTLVLSGPANNADPLYSYDKNNFQPRFAFAYTPHVEKGVLRKIFGDGKSVIRGGFGITNDYYGQQLAVNFDLANTLGFSSNQTIAANTYNVTTRPAPLFTGFGQDIRSLPRIVVPGDITFPRTQPFSTNPSLQQRRIESTLDSKLVAPINYSWNATFERELPHGLVLQTSYIGRLARKLIASRDVMALNNLFDPASGMDWYTAATQLEIMRSQGVPTSAIQQMPYFANILPADIAQRINDNYFGEEFMSPSLNQTQAVYEVALNFYGNDWTDTQDAMEQGLGRNIFFHPQYGALSAYSSIARSNYHAGTLSLRERLGRSLTMDFNYTYSHSWDDASGLQTSTAYNTTFILNPLRQRDQYAESDFDIRHLINANAVWEMPFGRNRRFFSDINKVADAFLGGWQLSSIFRWNSGLPFSAPYDDARWATNWNAQSSAVRIAPVESCPTRGGKLFGCNTLSAYQSFRNPYPGETGDRNILRLPGFVNLDLGLSKSFNMPWSEKHSLQIRFEAFNATNTQRMGDVDTSRTGFGIALDPQNVTKIGDIPTNWSNFTSIQGQPRVMQIGLRYSF